MNPHRLVAKQIIDVLQRNQPNDLKAQIRTAGEIFGMLIGHQAYEEDLSDHEFEALLRYDIDKVWEHAWAVHQAFKK